MGRLWNVTVAPDGEILALLRELQPGASLLLVRYGAKYHRPQKAYRYGYSTRHPSSLRRAVVVPGAGLEPARPLRSGDFKFP